jgi:Xaa-Pro dipeptidase
MFSRRHFLRTSCGAASLTPLLDGQRERDLGAEFNGALPPAIAALEPMTAIVRPFTNAEREARIEKARRLMVTEKMDAIVLTGGPSPEYFANVQLGGGERFWALVIPARSNPFLVVPAFEEAGRES